MSPKFSGVSGRSLAVAAALLASTVALTSCSGGSETEGDSTDSTWETVTTTGAFGDAVVTEQPERVLALSTTDADMLFSVGVASIAVPSMPQTDAATNGTSMYPWQVPLYPAGTPKIDASTTEVNVEAIAEAAPDLIVATAFWGLTDATYAHLAAIAPVVHYDTEANADGWQESTRKIAEAVGRVGEADEAISDADEKVERVSVDHPELVGKTFNAVISPSPDEIYILCSEEDNMGRVMADFGLKLSDYAQSVECDGGKAAISWENVPQLDADLLWVIPDNPEQLGVLTDNPLWNALPAVQRGAYFVVPKTEGVPFAIAFPSPLSLSWAVDQLAPQVAEASAQ
jgi:iron complex transport system substrate-binding protein